MLKNQLIMRKITKESSISNDRKTILYRLLESSLAISSIGFIIGYILLAIFAPIWAAIFIICYSLIWLLKFFLNVIYTLYTYLQYRRWNSFDWQYLIKNFSNYGVTAVYLKEQQEKYRRKFDWQKKLEIDLENLELIQGSKFAHPENIYNVAVFATYNESSEVLLKSLECLYKSKWDLEKLIVVVSQEARWGSERNKSLRDKIAKNSWLKTTFLDSINKKQSDLANLPFQKNRLNVFFTEHPDGLVGEIKGKASNEDWGARQATRLIQAKKIDPEMVLVTSLDADSHISQWFFHNLAYKYCLTPDRNRCGFQPVHVYSNNFFQIGIISRQVANQTTLHNLTNLALDGEMYFFAIYSVPLTVLMEVDYWVREVIAEDYLLFIKCFTHYNGNFRIVPHFGVFEGDAVEADDYLEEILNQYKQLQRWAWGGVEGFPYLFKHLYLTDESKNIPLKQKIKWTYLKFSNHFFWVTTPFVFSIGPAMPQLLYGETFEFSAVAQNLSYFTQWFSWISYIFIFSFGYLTFMFLAVRASKDNRLTIPQIISVLIQLVTSPLIYGIMAIPAFDAQIRGLLGKYLGYWVTPKS
jgi:hypothetical protein